MPSLSQKIDQLIDKYSLLKHPFYMKWSEGSLPKNALKGYAKEYFHMVKAVPDIVESILSFQDLKFREEIDSLRKDEIKHIDLWLQFTKAFGYNDVEIKQYTPFERTEEVVKSLSNMITDFDNGAVLMYALEKEIPAVSRSKLDGLKKYYPEVDQHAQEYFEVHVESDLEHAEVWKNIIDTIPEDQHEDYLQLAENALKIHSQILDVCLEQFC